MKYTTQRKEYTINLKLPESLRWEEVIKHEKTNARKLLKEAMGDSLSNLRFSKPLITSSFVLAYKILGGLYRGEIESWANAIGCTPGEMTLANCSYELSYLADDISIFGCSAGIKWVPLVGYVHVRNLDWPLRSIGDNTRVFRFQHGKREFITIGANGHISVLSGMLPKKYSVTINWAPSSKKLPLIGGWGPSFLLRDVFETCDTFDEAVSYLQGTDLAQPVFFTVCGTKKGEACIIERQPQSYQTRWIDGDTLVQTNHFVSKQFKKYNEPMYDSEDGGESQIDDSVLRHQSLQKQLIAAGTLMRAFKVLNHKGVLSEDSFQQMVFHPKSGEYAIRRKVSS